MEALGNSTAVTRILEHEREKGEKRFKKNYSVSQNEHKTRLKFQSNFHQREYLPWDVVFDITRAKFLMASQIREILLLHILLQDFQSNLLGYRKTVISSVAFDSAWSLELCVSGLGNMMDTESARRWYLTWDPAVLFQVSLLVTARGELTDSISEVRWTLIWMYNAVKQHTDFALLCS